MLLPNAREFKLEVISEREFDELYSKPEGVAAGLHSGREGVVPHFPAVAVDGTVDGTLTYFTYSDKDHKDLLLGESDPFAAIGNAHQIYVSQVAIKLDSNGNKLLCNLPGDESETHQMPQGSKLAIPQRELKVEDRVRAIIAPTSMTMGWIYALANDSQETFYKVDALERDLLKGVFEAVEPHLDTIAEAFEHVRR